MTNTHKKMIFVMFNVDDLPFFGTRADAHNCGLVKKFSRATLAFTFKNYKL